MKLIRRCLLVPFTLAKSVIYCTIWCLACMVLFFVWPFVVISAGPRAVRWEPGRCGSAGP